MKTTWAAKAYGILENGNRGWFTLKTFTDFEEVDNWLCDYINNGGYYYGDFKVVKA